MNRLEVVPGGRDRSSQAGAAGVRRLGISGKRRRYWPPLIGVRDEDLDGDRSHQDFQLVLVRVNPDAGQRSVPPCSC
jgi:hypothetical protein